MPLDAALHLAEQNRVRYGLRMYLMRALGLGLGAICVAAVLYEHGASPALWGLLAANGFAWPHLAYLRVRARRDDPLHRLLRGFRVELVDQDTAVAPDSDNPYLHAPHFVLHRSSDRANKENTAA